jgi:dienelactone hydrolase
MIGRPSPAPLAAMRRILLALALLLALPAAPRAEEPLLVEETFLSVEIGGQPFRLHALVVKEAGLGRRLPIAMITHGQAAEAERRERLDPRIYLRAARDFARRGYLAVVVVRRGFGRSEGDRPLAVAACRNGDYGGVVEGQADDLEAALKAIGRRADADASQAVALGVSAGGAAVIGLAARRPEGLRAVVNVSGGMSSRRRDGTPAACGPDDLASYFAGLGARGGVPGLWLYAENDAIFPAEEVRRFHEAFVARGGRTDFQMFPPVGSDGHDMFVSNDGLLRILPALDRFLRANRLPTFDPAPVETALRELGLGTSSRALLARYHGRATEKALAVSSSNKTLYAAFNHGDLAQAEASALEGCAKQAGEPCRILARNFDVVREEPPAQRGSSAQ